jgi:hypothetical protein
MTMILHRPIRDVRELFQFLAHWRDVPAAVPPVVLPAGTPTPLRDLYQRFGSLAAREWWVGPNLCWSVGLFSGQNFLVAPTRLGKDSFAAAGERHWLIVRENQECWFVWVPAGKDEDPLIAYTAAHEEPSASALEMTKIPLSQFLATHVLVETSFASPRLWCIGDRPFRVGEFPIATGAADDGLDDGISAAAVRFPRRSDRAGSRHEHAGVGLHLGRNT